VAKTIRDLGTLADAAKASADRAADSIEEMLAFVEASNKRIAAMENKAVEDMRKFMQAATPVRGLDLKAIIDDGRR
jgi:hypothetical protein